MNELARRGWEQASETLLDATSPDTLVTHWFVTAADDSVHRDPHLGGDQRTLTFLSVVVPTLVERLDATAAVVSVPWSLDSQRPLMILLAVAAGQPTRIEARMLLRTPRLTTGPWWSLSPADEQPPASLVLLAERLPAGRRVD